MQWADRGLDLIRTFEPKVELKYYIGLSLGNRANNFVSFVPQKAAIRVSIKVPRTDETDALLKDSGLDFLGYDRRWREYNLRLGKDDMNKYAVLLTDLMKKARKGGVE